MFLACDIAPSSIVKATVVAVTLIDSYPDIACSANYKFVFVLEPHVLDLINNDCKTISPGIIICSLPSESLIYNSEDYEHNVSIKSLLLSENY